MNPSQDSPQTPASSSPSYEHIRCAPGVVLSTAQLELLAQAFDDAELIFVKREFRSGYSGALVLLVSLGAARAPVVVKLAHPLDLQREYRAYQEFVRQISPQNIAHLQGEPLLSADGQLGLIEYSFAGGDSHQAAASLHDYFKLKGGSACAAILNRIFRAYGRYWWANNRPTLYTLGEQYDRLLPVHLQAGSLSVEVEPDREPDYILEPGKTSIVTLRQIDEGETIRMLRFQVAKISIPGQKMTLVADPLPNEASAPLRIRLELDEPREELLTYRIGDMIDQLDAVVTATRLRLICLAAEEAVPSYEAYEELFIADITSPPETLNGITQLNPLYDLAGLLDRVIETKASIIHGDLNLQNILIDTPTGFAWIIDFGETRRGPTLLDLQRLEVQIITKLLPDSLREAELPPSAVAEMLVALHADHLPPAPPHPGLYETFQVLTIIRRLARQYMIDDLDWDEYYLGLIITLLGALKYEELDALARNLALVAGATARGLLGHQLEVGHQAPAATTASQHQEPAQASAADPTTTEAAAPPLPPMSSDSSTAGPAPPVTASTPERGTPSRTLFIRIGAGILVAVIGLVTAMQMGWVPGIGAPDIVQTPAVTTPTPDETAGTNETASDPPGTDDTPGPTTPDGNTVAVSDESTATPTSTQAITPEAAETEVDETEADETEADETEAEAQEVEESETVEPPIEEPAAEEPTATSTSTPTPEEEEPTPTPEEEDSTATPTPTSETGIGIGDFATQPTATPAFEVLDLAARADEVDRSSPDYIRAVQDALNQVLELELTVDGVMGSATRNAIRRFQAREGLAVDGVIGSETEQALIAALASEPGAESTPEPIAEEAAEAIAPPPGYMAGDTWEHPIDGAVYVFVPEGEFEMGAEGEGAELQPHTVHISDFWIMQMEVTNAQYKLCVDADVCAPPRNDRWEDSDYADHPVTEVDWNQADTYARWIGGRLPTEAEWEKAARGTDGRIYPWGDDLPDADLLNFNLSMVGNPMPVGSYRAGASPYGALDMAGNVEEWVADWYDPEYYANSPDQDPTGPEEGRLRVLRGGSYTSNRRVVSTFNRAPALPEMQLRNIGFRVAISP